MGTNYFLSTFCLNYQQQLRLELESWLFSHCDIDNNFNRRRFDVYLRLQQQTKIKIENGTLLNTKL